MDYDTAPTDPRHGGKLTPDMMADRIAELEGEISVLRLQLAARVCSECPAKARLEQMREALFDLVHMERTQTPDMSGKRRRFAYMRNGAVLAQCLDRARDLLGDKV